MTCTKTKAPESATGIAKLMEMDVAEVRAWPFLEEVRSAIKDYNLGYITKQRLLSQLENIAIKNQNSELNLQHYAAAITENLVTSLRLSY